MIRKIWLVLRYEVITTVTRRSFLLTTIGVPLVSTLIFIGVSALNRSSPSTVSAILGPGSQGQGTHEGYVDYSGLIRSVPPSIPSGALKAYQDESAAQKALGEGKISGFYIIPRDYLSTGKVIFVQPEFNPLSTFDQTGLIQYVLDVNLLGGNIQLANRIRSPMKLQVELQQSAPQRDENNPLTFLIPYAVTMVYYIIILMSATLLLNSVTKEKENRVVEILMSAVTPRQLLSGKIIGLGLVGLLQTGLWVGTGYTLLRLSGQTFQIPAVFQLPPVFLLWGLVFFLLGYAVYASLMAGVGALVPNLREASQATFMVVFPLIIPLMAISLLINEPDSSLSVGLSLFPLTAPIAMMTRLAATNVPTWQILLSAGLLALTAILIVRAVAGMFRAQTLLSGQPFNLKRLFSALGGRL